LAAGDENETTSLLAMLNRALGPSKDAFQFDRKTAVESDPLSPCAIEQPTSSPPEPLELLAEPPPTIAPPRTRRQPDDRIILSADKVQDLLVQGLAKMPGFPERGVSVTVYGSRPWNAMLSFAVGSVSYQSAIALRGALRGIVNSLRPTIDVEPD
jgi:hypothetical protein